MVWLLVQETIVSKRWGGREAMAWFKAHDYMKDVLFSIATLSRIENIFVLMINEGSRQQSS